MNEQFKRWWDEHGVTKTGHFVIELADLEEAYLAGGTDATELLREGMYIGYHDDCTNGCAQSYLRELITRARTEADLYRRQLLLAGLLEEEPPHEMTEVSDGDVR